MVEFLEFRVSGVGFRVCGGQCQHPPINGIRNYAARAVKGFPGPTSGRRRKPVAKGCVGVVPGVARLPEGF